MLKKEKRITFLLKVASLFSILMLSIATQSNWEAYFTSYALAIEQWSDLRFIFDSESIRQLRTAPISPDKTIFDLILQVFL